MSGIPGHRVVVFLQENKTTDFYSPTMAAWGAAVANHGALLSSPPDFDQPHDRNAWVHYSMGDYPALAAQVDTDVVIPFYSWLAKQFVFCDHHFGSGSNSTPGHMLAIGGQMPTMKNPPFVGPHPVWDLPSIFSVAQTAGMGWAAFPDQSGYPTKFYASLSAAPGNAQVHPPSQFVPMAKAGTLPAGLLRVEPVRATTSTRRSSATPATSPRARTWSGSGSRPSSTAAAGTTPPSC